jgi:hypothetical protein
LQENGGLVERGIEYLRRMIFTQFALINVNDLASLELLYISS